MACRLGDSMELVLVTGHVVGVACATAGFMVILDEVGERHGEMTPGGATAWKSYVR